MNKIPNIAGEYRSYEFDKDAQGAYEYYFKVEQTGDKVSLYYSVYDPYDRQTREYFILGQIISWDERISVIKIRDSRDEYYLFDYNRGRFAQQNYMNVIHFYLDNSFSLHEKFNLLLELSNIALSGILQQDIEFRFPQQLEENGLSDNINGYQLEKDIDKEREDVRLRLITLEHDLFTFYSFITGKRDDEIINYAFAEIQYFSTGRVSEIFNRVKVKLSEKYGDRIEW